MGFQQPTAIQSQAIPVLLEGERDFIGLAQTGTGKTAAFGLPLLESIDGGLPVTQALILAPTRELGQQIAEQLNLFSQYLQRVNVLAVYGGAPIVNQIKALKSAPQHVIIATPGRLIDLIDRKAIKLDHVRLVVLDEADEMLNMGFKEDLDHILKFTPAEKNTWLFSATMPAEIKRIVNTYMVNPVEIKATTGVGSTAKIEHTYALVKDTDKALALLRFMDQDPDMRGIVFCRTKKDTQELADYLLQKGYRADSLHGDLSQPQRDKVMKSFKAHGLQVLIATDVAARGIDVQDLTHVFHFNLPDDFSYYTHRAGRTARAGKQGISIAFISPRQHFLIRRMESTLGIIFNRIMIPNSAEIAEKRIENWCVEVLKTPTKKAENSDVIEHISMMFGNLSKEELVAKLIALELNKMNQHDKNDLNMSLQPEYCQRPKSQYRSSHQESSYRGSRGSNGGNGRRDQQQNSRNKPERKGGYKRY